MQCGLIWQYKRGVDDAAASHKRRSLQSTYSYMYVHICMCFISFFHITVSCGAGKHFYPSWHHSYFIFHMIHSSDRVTHALMLLHTVMDHVPAHASRSIFTAPTARRTQKSHINDSRTRRLSLNSSFVTDSVLHTLIPLSHTCCSRHRPPQRFR